MDKRTYQKQISVWWRSLETEADNIRSNPMTVKPVGAPYQQPLVQSPPIPVTPAQPPKRIPTPAPSLPIIAPHMPVLPKEPETFSKCEELSFERPPDIESCFIVKEALQKLHQFLTMSHRKGCSDENCRFNSKTFKLKMVLKPIKSKPLIEGRVLKKRGRKSKLELQQLAALNSGVNQ